MADFQSIAPQLGKVREVGFGNTKYRFAPLGYIADEIKAPMKQCGLSYRFEITPTDKGLSVACIVTHVDGHAERTQMTAPADGSGSKNAIQALGSSVTYLQRYTLLAALGLTTGIEDTDGREDEHSITHEQADELAAEIKRTGADINKILTFGACAKLDTFPAAKYAGVVAQLKKRPTIRAALEVDENGQAILEGVGDQGDAEDLP